MGNENDWVSWWEEEFYFLELLSSLKFQTTAGCEPQPQQMEFVEAI